jgi:hypothetical protein
MRIWPTKRVWKRIGLGIVILLALAFIANGFMAWWTDHRLQQRIAAIRAAGDPASIADLAPKPIPDAENAAAILKKLQPRLDAFSHEYARFFDDSPLGKDYGARTDRGEAATPQQIAAIEKILNKYADIDAGLAAAVACGKYASVSDFSVGYPKFLERTLKWPAGSIRTAARYLEWRMEVSTATGQRDQAVQQGIEILKLARLYDHEPLFINMLVAIAMRGIAVAPIYDALAAGPVSPAMHAALDQELARQEDPQRMFQTMKTERAFSIDAMQAIPNVGKAGGPPAWLFRIIGWPAKRFYIGALDYWNVELAELSLPWHEGVSNVARRMALKEPTGYGPLADLLIPATQAAFDADARCTAQLRALRIFNAVRQYAEKNGHEAAGLQDLGLPKEATIDPFDGKPLKLKQTDDGWIVYSVAVNGVDDGGSFIDMKDYGVAPRKYRRTQAAEADASADGKAAEGK